jgi:hypothetical protein
LTLVNENLLGLSKIVASAIKEITYSSVKAIFGTFGCHFFCRIIFGGDAIFVEIYR